MKETKKEIERGVRGSDSEEKSNRDRWESYKRKRQKKLDAERQWGKIEGE